MAGRYLPRWLLALAARLLPAYEPNVQRELYALGWRNMRASAVSPLVATAIFAYAYGDVLPSQGMALWAAMMVAATLSVIAVRRLFRAAMDEQVHDAAKDARLQAWLVLHFAVSGLAWGGMGLLFSPALPIHNAVLMVSFLGVVAIGAGNMGVHSLLGYCTMLLAGCPLVLLLLPRGFGDDAIGLQAGVVVFATVTALAARNAHATMVHAIRLQFANEQLLQQKVAEAQRAERANRDKSLFLAAASHDLRQPVHALLLLVEALRQRRLDAGARELVGYVQEAGSTIGKLFSALMELSRLESGSERPELSDFELEPVLRALLERHRQEALRRGLGLSLAVSRRAAGAWVHTDRMLLERIADNLVSNAIRYTEHGRVLVTVRREGPALALGVHDSGIGMAPVELERIFEPYYQVANPERDRGKGLGLGLAIVHRTALLLGMDLRVRSRLGQGSAFRVTLPATQAKPAHAPAQRTDERWRPSLGARRVLVIDDDAMVLRAMQVLLTGWGVDWRCVDDAAGARAIVQAAWTPEVVICDFRLRGERNGIELLEELAECWPGMAAILQTGELAPEVRDAAEDAGLLVLAKPVAATTLGRTLEALMGVR